LPYGAGFREEGIAFKNEEPAQERSEPLPVLPTPTDQTCAEQETAEIETAPAGMVEVKAAESEVAEPIAKQRPLNRGRPELRKVRQKAPKGRPAVRFNA
jgi:hypothetical protein